MADDQEDVVSQLGRALGPGSLKLQRRGDGPPRWVLAWRDARGHRHRQALSTDRRAAERMRSQIIAKRDLEAGGLGAVEGQSMLLVDLSSAYLSDLRTRVGNSQYVNVKLRLEHTLAALSAQRVRDLRVIDVLKLRAERVNAGASNRTANCDVAALRAMLNWAVQSQLIAESPLRGIKRLPDGEANQVCRRRAMTEDETRSFLAAARVDDERNDIALADRRMKSRIEWRSRGVTFRRSSQAPRVPQTLLFEFLVSFGARYGEARTLAWADVDLHSRTATLRAENTKSHRARCVPISRAFAAELVELRELHGRVLGRDAKGRDHVFLSPEGKPLREDTVNCMRVFDRLLEAAGIARVDQIGRKLDIHALRGTCASTLARRGVGIAIAQKLLGHSSPTLTAKHYLRLELDDVREAIESAPSVTMPGRPRLVREELEERA
ncbi:MAG: site-specific integrase [Planctomycetes bacterium]|nr:site-specific integrase [Planctomycetota bacterium]